MAERLALDLGEHTVEVCFDGRMNGTVRLDVIDWSGRESTHAVIQLSHHQAQQIAYALLEHADQLRHEKAMERQGEATMLGGRGNG